MIVETDWQHAVFEGETDLAKVREALGKYAGKRVRLEMEWAGSGASSFFSGTVKIEYDKSVSLEDQPFVRYRNMCVEIAGMKSRVPDGTPGSAVYKKVLLTVKFPHS